MSVRRHHVGVAAALAVAAVALVVVSIAMATSGSGRERSRPTAVPDWFWPVWDYYDRNPRVTPAFDFAGLYASKQGTGPHARR
jgi:hypothetical protein